MHGIREDMFPSVLWEQVQMFFDRTSTSVAKCQMSYLEVFGTSMFDTLALFMPEACMQCVGTVALPVART